MAVDVAKIVEEIRADIKAQGLRDDTLEFENISLHNVDLNKYVGKFDKSEMIYYLDQMNEHHSVNPIKPLGTHPVKVFVKKLIRKLVSFVLYPIVEDQNEMNAFEVKFARTVAMYIQQESQRKDDAYVRQLEERIARLENMAKKEWEHKA